MSIEIRLACVGALGVGKSAITVRFVTGKFVEDYDPTIEDSYRKVIKLKNYDGSVIPSSDLMLNILDTAGNDEYSDMRDRYTRIWHGFALVYSITSRDSFEELDALVDHIKRVLDVQEFPFILVANKCDLVKERQVSTKEGHEFAIKIGGSYIETSAKEDKNITNVFEDLAKTVRLFQQKDYEILHPTSRGLFSKKQKSEKPKPAILIPKVPSARLYDDTEGELSPPAIVVPESTYIRDMKQLLADMDFTDVYFKTIDKEQLIPAHKFIVIARCPKMRSLIESNGEKPEISIPFHANIFQYFLTFAYTDAIDISAEDVPTEVPLLLNLSQQWNMVDLTSLISQQYPNFVPQEQPELLINQQQEELHSVPKFRRDLKRALFASGSDYKSFDVKFIIKDEPGNSILAHKAILSQRSPYFRAMFTGGTRERKEYEIEMGEIPHVVLLSILEYCYTDDVRYVIDDIAADMLIASNKFCLGRLKTKMAAHIANGLTLENILLMYRLSKTADAEWLDNYCSFFILRILNKLSNMQKDFATLLSNDEITHFREIRSTWSDIEGIEDCWYSNMLKKDNEGEQARDSTKTKKCIVM